MDRGVTLEAVLGPQLGKEVCCTYINVNRSGSKTRKSCSVASGGRAVSAGPRRRLL